MFGGLELVVASPITIAVIQFFKSLVNYNGVYKQDVEDAITDVESAILYHIDRVRSGYGKELSPSQKEDLRAEVVKFCRSYNFSNGQKKQVEKMIRLIQDELDVRMPSSLKIHVRSLLQSRTRDSYLNK